MKSHTSAQIYKAHLRGQTENGQQRVLATFNFEGYTEETRRPFGNLIVLNDEVLAPGQAVKRQVTDHVVMLIIPLTGGLAAMHNNTHYEIFADEALAVSACDIMIKNPYENDLLNFLYIEFKASISGSQIFHFQLETHNVLHPFIDMGNLRGSIGIFNGRQEAVYTPQHGNGLFAFIVNGAFEIEGRLLEERDGLALWDTEEAELEAPSENAIILLFELVL